MLVYNAQVCWYMHFAFLLLSYFIKQPPNIFSEEKLQEIAQTQAVRTIGKLFSRASLLVLSAQGSIK